MKTFGHFDLHLSTEIVFGKGTEARTGELVQKYGGTKVLLVYGGGSIKRIGLYDRVIDSLHQAGISYVELAGVQPNPRRSLCDKGIEIARANGVDFILAVGGGSTLDTAKAISYALCYEGDWWDFYSGKAVPQARVPVGSIHTISAAGSETSTGTVIVDDVDTGAKKGGSGPLARPVFAIMNPELTYTVNAYQTGAGTSDIFAHTLERYFYPDDCALGDAFAEGLLRTVIKYGPLAIEKPNDYEARAELMLCGSFAHNDITGIGHTPGRRGGPHALESAISAFFDTAHGAGLAVVMPAWLRLVADSGEAGCARVAQLAVNVFGVSADMADLKLVAYEGIARFRHWLNALGMPSTLTQMGLKESDIQTLVDNGRYDANGQIAGYIYLNRQELDAFYHSVL